MALSVPRQCYSDLSRRNDIRGTDPEWVEEFRNSGHPLLHPAKYKRCWACSREERRQIVEKIARSAG